MQAQINKVKQDPKYQADTRKLEIIETLDGYNQILERSLGQIEERLEELKSELKKPHNGSLTSRKQSLKTETLKSKKSLQNSQIKQSITYLSKLKSQEKSLKQKLKKAKGSSNFTEKQKKIDQNLQKIHDLQKQLYDQNLTIKRTGEKFLKNSKRDRSPQKLKGMVSQINDFKHKILKRQAEYEMQEDLTKEQILENTDKLEFQNEEILEKIEKVKGEKKSKVLNEEGKKKDIERVTAERDEAKEIFENMKKENEQEIKFSKKITKEVLSEHKALKLKLAEVVKEGRMLKIKMKQKERKLNMGAKLNPLNHTPHSPAKSKNNNKDLLGVRNSGTNSMVNLKSTDKELDETPVRVSADIGSTNHTTLPQIK
ncbi:unnamed protein product [Moneuplotes crassus]|uniref:Uncharacterized protein n=2 Tax=Euplotes crassus TaxID=5936 RepID=A0AAD1XE17_EUPCR|nr:unnamed protein product [Moneuplotes crassus]